MARISYLTPNGNFLFAAERTRSAIGGFRVDPATRKLSYLGSTPTEKPTGKGSNWVEIVSFD